MNRSFQKKWFSMATISGVVLASSLLNANPAKAWINPVSSLESSPMFSLNSGKSYPQFMEDKFKGIAYLTSLETSLQKSSPNNEEISEKPDIQSSNLVKTAEKANIDITKKTSALTSDKSKSVSVTQPQATSKKASQPTNKIASQVVSRGSDEVDRLINRALSLQGVPYLWGGTTPKGFDCSGFVGYVFKASGISLPRTSFEMYKVGTPVSRDQLRPGDLVFFSTYTAGASDVRIYIGGGRTIGASSDGVAIHSLSESYWNKHYLGARRVL